MTMRTNLDLFGKELDVLLGTISLLKLTITREKKRVEKLARHYYNVCRAIEGHPKYSGRQKSLAALQKATKKHGVTGMDAQLLVDGLLELAKEYGRNLA